MPGPFALMADAWTRKRRKPGRNPRLPLGKDIPVLALYAFARRRRRTPTAPMATQANTILLGSGVLCVGGGGVPPPPPPPVASLTLTVAMMVCCGAVGASKSAVGMVTVYL